MEKLIELLNVYRKEKYPKSKLRYYKYDSLNHVFLSNCIPNDSEEKVLGRRFWFIQRLVKHFMFDMTKIDARIALSDFNATDRMLMALAISEDPITLLIDCLE